VRPISIRDESAVPARPKGKAKDTAAATSVTAKALSKPAARPRRRPVQKKVLDRRRPLAEKSDETNRSDDAGQWQPERLESARQAEHLAILALALICGLLGLAVHVMWFAAIVLMAVLLGLIASQLRGPRGGGVVSGVVSTVIVEAKSVGEDIARAGNPQSEPDSDAPATPSE